VTTAAAETLLGELVVFVAAVVAATVTDTRAAARAAAAAVAAASGATAAGAAAAVVSAGDGDIVGSRHFAKGWRVGVEGLNFGRLVYNVLYNSGSIIFNFSLTIGTIIA
jgi:hypothetical protein